MSKTGFYEGRLGIGLTSTMGMGDGNPRYPLDINGDIRLTGAIVNATGDAINMVNPDSMWTVGTNVISYTAGNVGIGTATPSNYLHIHSSDDIANYSVPQLLITADPPIGNYNQYASLELRGSYQGITNPYGVGIRSTYGWDGNNRTYGDLHFWTTDKNNGNARTDRMTVTSEGYVLINQAIHLGLGTGAKFQVNGTGVFCHNGSSSNCITIGHNSQRALIESKSTTHNLDFYVNNDCRLSILPAGNVVIGATSVDATDNKLEVKGGNLLVRNDNGTSQVRIRGGGGHTSYVRTDSAGKMILESYASYADTTINAHSGGNVGIGTSSPGYKLDVNGDINLTGKLYGGGVVLKFGLYDFTSHTFTNVGVTGRLGPTLSDCTSAYSSATWTSNLDYFDVPNNSGYQLWTVPATGDYAIIAMGASDGWDQGKGNRITATYTLTMGDKYWICIGQKGTKGGGAGNWWASGGGGGTFMVKKITSGYSGATINDVLIIAGGGGGSNASGGAVGNYGQNATNTTTSTSTSTAGGSGTGNGGSGGAGFIGNGSPSAYVSKSFQNNLSGSVDNGYGGGDGGFGGGGMGGGNPGGGGGGVFGGNFGDSAATNPGNSAGGDAGGSYYKTGYSTYSVNTGTAGHGYLTITLVATASNLATKVGIGTTSPKTFLNVANVMANNDANNVIPTGSSVMNDTTSLWLGKGTTATENYWGLMMGTLYSSGASYIHNVHSNNITHYDLLLQPLGGNVGIGTTSPEYPLQIGNLGAGGNVYSETKHNRIAFPSHSHSNNRYLFANRDPDNNTACLDLHYVHNTASNNKHLMTFNSDGNVGIGTTSPGAPLHVKDNDAYGEPIAKFEATGDAFILIENNKTAADFDEVGVVIKGHSSAGYWLAGVDDSSAYQIKYDTADFHFGNQALGLLITTDGNVGIGTASPADRLHLGSPGGTGESYALRIGAWNGSTNGFKFYQADSTAYLRIDYMSGNTIDKEIMTLRYQGQVGINTTAPDYQLEVRGDVALLSGPSKTSLVMGHVSASSTYHGRWMYGGHHLDIYASSSTQGEASTSNGTNYHINYFAHNGTSTIATCVGGPLAVGYNGGDLGRKDDCQAVLFLTATYNKTGWSWGWWLGGQGDGNWTTSDGDLYFHVCRGSTTGHDAAYIQDGHSAIQMNFTGQHRTFVKDIPHKKIDPYIGLIVSSNQNKYIKMGDKKMGGVETGNKAITISEALPVVALTRKEKDKSCFGVICDVEDERRREFGGNVVSIYQKEKGDTRVFINSLGEGAIWVSNKNGNLEAGDYITTGIIPGYGQKQDSEFLANYTVAKITMDCDFNPQQQKVKKIKKHDIKVTYYKSVIPKGDMEEWHDKPTPWHDYIEEDDEWVSILIEKDYNKKSDEEWDGDWEHPTKSCYTKIEKDELENDIDENNEFIWEDTEEYESAYNLRYLLEDGTQITKEDYETKKANNENVYIAAFVGCTYHCG